MRVSRNVLAALLLLIPLLAFAAGGAEDKAAGPVQLQFGIYTDPAREKVAGLQTELFMKKYPHIKVEVVSIPYSKYYSQLGSGIAAGDAWDAFMINGAYFSSAAPKGALLELTEALARNNLDMDKYVYDPTCSKYQGKIYAVPYELNMSAVYYNQDMFDNAGLAYPKWGWNWSEFLSAAQALTIREGNETKQYGFLSKNYLPTLNSFITQAGGSILNEDRTKSALDTPEVEEAIQFMVDLVRVYKVSPTPADIAPNIDPFKTNMIAMVGKMDFEVIPTLQVPFRWGIAPWPVHKRPGADYWTQGVAIFKGTRNRDSAETLALFMISRDAQIVTATERGTTPSLRELQGYSDMIKSPPDGMEVFLRQYNEGYGAIEPFSDKWFKICGPNSVLNSEINNMFLGQTGVKEGLAKAHQEVNRVLSE